MSFTRSHFLTMSSLCLGLVACTGALSSAETRDGGVTNDAFVAMDAHAEVDGEVPSDSGAGMDATLAQDSSLPRDSGAPRDAGPPIVSPVVVRPELAPVTPLCTASGCHNYYVSTSGNDSNDGLSEANAWRSLAHVEAMRTSIQPGDSILFKRGDQFSEVRFGWRKSGEEGRPITFGNYGSGPLPLFELAPGSTTELEGRDLFYFENASYIVVDGFNITDLDIAGDPVRLEDHDMFAYVGTAIRFDAYSFETPIHDVLIKNCDISLVGMGIVWIGVAHSTMENNRIVNLKNLVNTCGEEGTFMSYEDYGANGLTLRGDDNRIVGNYFEGNWATSCDFGFNGGAIELFGGVNRNEVLYNTFIDCGGIAEFGSNDGATMSDNVFAYNLAINNGALSWLNIDGPFASNVSNVLYFNNTIIDVGNRFTDSFLFGYSGDPTAPTVFNLKNNIFYISSGLDIVSGRTDEEKLVHENNVYALSGGAATNFTMGSTEHNAEVAGLFTDFSAENPLSWDFAPPSGSVCIGGGQDLGMSQDRVGRAVTNPPDIGAFQH